MGRGVENLLFARPELVWEWRCFWGLVWGELVCGRFLSWCSLHHWPELQCGDGA